MSSSGPPPDPPSREAAGDSPSGPEASPNVAPVLVPTAPAVSGPDGGGPTAAPPVTSRPGASIFTIEGRSAPGLFVVGWLATLVGVACVIVAVLSGGGTAAVVLLVVGLVLLSVGLIAGAGAQGIERRVRATLPYRGPSPLLVFAAAIPVSVLIGVLVSIPLTFLGVPLDGPFGALLSVSVQAVVYIALVRLLVVDPGALDWRAMGVRALNATAFAEMGRGALWAIPVITVTALVSGVLLRIFPVVPVSPLPPTGDPVGFAVSLLAGVIVAPVRRGDPVPGVRDHGLGPRARLSARPRDCGAGLRLRPCPDDQRLERRRCLRPRGGRLRCANPGRARTRLDLPPARDGLGVVRAPRRVQRDPADPRRSRESVARTRVSGGCGAPRTPCPRWLAR